MKEKEKRIKTKISRTAEITCLIRAASFFEKKPQYNSNDFIAPKLIPKYLLPFLKTDWIRHRFINKNFPPGMYEYVIARTKFIDSLFQNALSDNFSQILLFGAGFDSRGIRFNDRHNLIKIFEMDAPITQNAKIDQLKKRKIEIPSNIVFIPVDLNKDSTYEKLLHSGFDRNRKSLFILEGVLMYLDEISVDSTFHVINEFARSGSEIVFDFVYSSVLRGENRFYGESGMTERLEKEHEAWTFGIEQGTIQSFLEERDLHLIQSLCADDLEKKYFTNEDGVTVGKINGTHTLVHARK